MYASFAVSATLFAGCETTRISVDFGDVILGVDGAVTSSRTLPYEARFVDQDAGNESASGEYPLVFSLAEAERQLKEQMCGDYWVQDAHPALTDCSSEVQQKITIEDGPLVTARAGDPANPMIVFVHGWPDSAALWVNQLLRFSRTYFCVAVQLPNFLDALPTEELFIDEYVARIGEVMGDRPTILVGHDWGAALVYMAAYKFPDAVLKVASMDIGNDIQMGIDMHPETRNYASPTMLFNAWYQQRIAASYRNCGILTGRRMLEGFTWMGFAPRRSPTCRMGILYERFWNRVEFQQRLAPDVPVEDWQSWMTPLNGTGIPQSGMLYIHGTWLYTTERFLDAVRADGGTVLQLTDGQAGNMFASHWMQLRAPAYVNDALERWFSGTGADILDTVPYDTPAFTGCSQQVVQDVYDHGFRLSETRRSGGRMSFYVRCAGDASKEPNLNKISCIQDHCDGNAWCFVPNHCSSRSFSINTCKRLDNQNPLNCVQ